MSILCVLCSSTNYSSNAYAQITPPYEFCTYTSVKQYWITQCNLPSLEAWALKIWAANVCPRVFCAFHKSCLMEWNIMAVWGKSLLSTHMLVGLNNRNVEKCYTHMCESLFAHTTTGYFVKGKLSFDVSL